MEILLRAFYVTTWIAVPSEVDGLAHSSAGRDIQSENL